MRAITITTPGADPAIDERPDPRPSAGELLVRVRATSVNPVDTSVAAGHFAAVATYELPATLGRDFAGTVEAVGEGVSSFGVGDEVFGYVPPVAGGTVGRGAWAELLAVRPEEAIARRPAGLPVDEAGAAGTVGLTALACLDRVVPRAGSTVLVIGAAGGVGSMVVQLAAAAGARVVAPVRAEDADALRALGVAVVLERQADLGAALREAGVGPVDGLVDLVSSTPEAHRERAAAVRVGGEIAVVLPSAGAESYVEADPAAIGRWAEILGAGDARVPIGRRYALADAPRALRELGELPTRGKLAIAIA
jgi:NADPH:quinone reductase-like Zn-dependent oxidoreductase